MMQNGTDSDDLALATGSVAEHDLAVAVSHLPDTNSVEFPRKIRGGAYDRFEVDRFMSQVSQAIAEVRAATTSTRRELAALRAENAKLRGSGSDVEEEITAGAMGLLTQAQLIADKAIADAEHYARDLVLTARNQYREILERAETSAGQATATVGAQQQTGPAVPEIEYVRTYARVAQIQLRSVLESLTEQVDRLGSLPQAPQEHVRRADADEGPMGEPDWAPSTSGTPTQQG
jgi:cell division septum initiation protein DivIVA